MPVRSKNVLPLRPVPGAKKRDIATRWGGHQELLDDGYVPVVRTFLDHACRLKPFGLTPTEAMFVLQLMFHKWDDRLPYPSYSTIAARMNISPTYARKLGKEIEKKGLLNRVVRVGATNQFDLQPLFDRLAERLATPVADAATAPAMKRRKRRKKRAS